MVRLKRMFHSRWVFMILFSSAYPVITFINVNKTQLLATQWSRLILYFIVILFGSLLITKVIKRFFLRSSGINRIAFAVSIATVFFFFANEDLYNLKLYFLGFLTLPVLGYWLSNFKGLLNWFFIVIIMAVLFPAIQLTTYGIQLIYSSNKGVKEQAFDPNLGNGFTKTENPLNVYYFVPDTYPRSDRVKKTLGFDNKPFVEKLSSLGFYIAENSYSNYPTTFLSLSSLLEMDYLATENMKPFINKKRFFEVLEGNNAVVRRFRKHGYLFARSGPQRWDPTSCNGKEDICLNEQEGFSEFDYQFWGRTGVLRLFKKLNLITEYPKTTFQNIKQSLRNYEIDNPLFVFGHVLMPHPPYVFGSDCEPIDLLKEYSGLGEPGWWSDKSKALYLGELKCVNKQLAELVEFIIDNDPNSIIIIQADTGTHFGYDNKRFIDDIPLSEWSEEDLENNFANLTAIRIPQRFHKWLYPSISQVNLFRLIFAVIENKQPSFIADYSYSTHYDGGSGFGEVHKYER